MIQDELAALDFLSACWCLNSRHNSIHRKIETQLSLYCWKLLQWGLVTYSSKSNFWKIQMIPATEPLISEQQWCSGISHCAGRWAKNFCNSLKKSVGREEKRRKGKETRSLNFMFIPACHSMNLCLSSFLAVSHRWSAPVPSFTEEFFLMNRSESHHHLIFL